MLTPPRYTQPWFVGALIVATFVLTAANEAFFSYSEASMARGDTSSALYGALEDTREASEADLQADILAARSEQVQSLLDQGFQVAVEGEVYPLTLTLEDLEFAAGGALGRLQFEENFLERSLSELDQVFYLPPQDLRIVEANLTEVAYVTTDGDMSPGRRIDVEAAAIEMQKALDHGEMGIQLPVEEISAQILDATGQNLGTFELLGTGRSYFARSSWGREANIRKALNEHFNNILIPPGATFSYNHFLEDTGGWKTAYVIYHGEIIPETGGGLCQVSTTVYRAALDAGLDIEDRRVHTYYISYYEEYGNGLDATIYPGDQDLTFVNNTGSYVLMRSYDEGDNGFVELYGQDDGRVVTYAGPYTSNNQTPEIEEALGGLKYYQIAWKYRVERPDGTVEEEWLLSSYRSKVKQYTEEDVVTHPLLSF